ncbi:MAG: YraN family protein [Fuerstiella sp.]|nr:YraN family protein [Fuerstiella sp.]
MKRFLHRLLGDRGERKAVRFLKQQGYRILERQYRDRFGEVDIIAMDNNQIVFVEVKTRRTTNTGKPFEAVGLTKQKKIARVALAWLRAQHRLNQSCRFDVISIVWESNTGNPQIDHFKNAFEAPGKGQICG